MPTSVPLSLLDRSRTRKGEPDAVALHRTIARAQYAESLGYHRFWVAEHHGVPGIASGSPAVLLAAVGAATDTMWIGSGGVMLPNHAPLVVAEAFGTLASLFPGRIDLGLGRAPGTDPMTMRALRRDRPETEEDFPRDVAELQRLLGDAQPGQKLIAMPGAGTKVPIWLLGSSLFSAQLAAERGLPYAFASHFAPRMLLQALALYRHNFKPSAQLAKPYAIVGVPFIGAPTDDEAQYLASSTYQRVLGILTGRRGQLPAPVEGFMDRLDPQAQAAIADFLACAVIGGPQTVREGFQQLADATQADEFMIVSDVFDPALRLRSLDIAAAALREPAMA